jgi:CRP-like cAMP-binding protein
MGTAEISSSPRSFLRLSAGEPASDPTTACLQVVKWSANMDNPVTLEQVISFLLETPLFEDLTPNELAEVVQIMLFQRLRDGQWVFQEGDEGDAWFVIFRGECVVTKNAPAGPARTIALLQGRACFGEMAILDGSSRSATIRARGDVTVFKFPRDSFQELLSRGSLAAYKLIYAMARVLCGRQRTITQQLTNVIEDEGETGQTSLRDQLQSLVEEYKVSE